MDKGSSDPEGLTNDVFLGAFLRVDTFFGNEDGFISLLFSIARNKLVDEHRKRRRQVQISDDDLTDEPSGGDVENDALQRLGVEANALLEGLTDEQREVLHLRLIADLSIEQTALVTGRSINAVKALQHRATHSLRRSFSGESVTK